MSVNLAPFLCDENVCWAARDERPLYVDDDHVSAHGAEVIGAALMSLPAVLSLLAPDATKSAAGAKTTHLTNWSSGPER
jgi:hypothetical protein